ncbi:EI24 domain-containing protein [Lacisediminihabitans changchengi]|uniref:EI24 domain-containing protein n=1 Tax=Lacisediminihabitans changchengi TaxID=2787634 RepID=A0A934VXR6_9MICO|nr:EI24 domain-containing protein [Lacisediminihabitans changchengi]MBK4347222.1 EI24 domain-containing protein [Lacisediminihabitans changchengi]
MPSPVRDFVGGMAYLGRGLRVWATSPRLMLLGVIPAFIVGVVYVAAIVVLAVNLDTVVAWLTPFAAGWVEPWRAGIHLAVGVALIAAVVLLAVSTYAAVTLAVGDPFFERIWHGVEVRAGGAPAELDESVWRSLRRGLGNGIRLLVVAVLVAVFVFVVGLVPVVGPVAGPVIGAITGGWVLAIELSGYAFDARGLSLKERRRMLGARRARTLGFGVLTYVLFLVPLAGLALMPAAVAGATLLARDAVAGPGRSG